MAALSNTSACLSEGAGLSCNLRVHEPRYFDLGALFGRLERIEARRKRYAPGVAVAAPCALDAKLLAQGAAFEAAWAEEVTALIALKRSETLQTRTAARRARAKTARLAAAIEQTRAASLAGIQVKTRATLWRRNGEPLGRVGAEVRPMQAQ
jgi:hypothetical protein